MNSSEERRRKLLEQTRRLYSDRWEPPAVHPRYGNIYHRLYGYGDEEVSPGTFGVRLFLAFLLFAGFVTMDQQKYELFHMNSERIVKEISSDFNAAEVWKEL